MLEHNGLHLGKLGRARVSGVVFLSVEGWVTFSEAVIGAEHFMFLKKLICFSNQLSH